ncbi:hypothetical protein IQ270_14260 [Microcoleus sp. LEGE 07076]|uniref:hypothetical protein n=1 Tax=Microcoleus sp. LEGE 07076 TaxID=915322 RepID=UPI001882E550|nr:hypothetical protein [Microcoleus sp. LEGE 07076]MBE9185828.1 hypothetical protein [Microcoleus sp. LEGE 07076]
MALHLTTSLYRTQQTLVKHWGITQLYNNFFEEPTSQLFKLTDSDDILAQLLELNLELAEKEKRGEPVIKPCFPNKLKILLGVIISFVNLPRIT